MPRSEHEGIPPAIRLEVGERDGWCCRFCGKYLGPERAGIHHVNFGGGLGPGMGGRRVHDVEAMVTICWLPGDPVPRRRSCHDEAHTRKLVWQPLLLRCAQIPGVTALQLKRWSRP